MQDPVLINRIHTEESKDEAPKEHPKVTHHSFLLMQSSHLSNSMPSLQLVEQFSPPIAKKNGQIVSSMIESDNHADTCCFGPNFVMDSYTGQTCNVSGYNKKVNDTEVSIGTGFTIWTNPTSGKLHLFQVNQGLDIREILDHTLANPNQCRLFGVSWCDDAWDENRSLGMQLKDPELSIPFKMNGSFAEFETQTPTED